MKLKVRRFNKMIKINTRKTSIVKPAIETPRQKIPLTLVDIMRPFPLYASGVNIYRMKKGSVDPEGLRASLSMTLVHFYPMAGRYSLDSDGNMEIDCNGEGVLFVEAETTSSLEDLSDFAPSPEMSILSPTIDHTQDISSYPLMAVQVTYFKCGGVSISVCVEHHSVDGSSSFHLYESWCKIASGLDISTSPFFDRTSVLRPRDPPQPKFDHPEFSLYGSAEELSRTNSNLKVSVFKLTKEQLDHMQDKAKQTDGQSSNPAETNYSSFEVLAAHIWMCVCKARRLGSEVETRLILPVSARLNRWKPELPTGFFGNAVLPAMTVSRAGDLESKPLQYATSKIHETMVRTDSEYLRSAVDHLALLPDKSEAKFGCHFRPYPNFVIISWAKTGLINDAGLGWGPPLYRGPGSIKSEKAYILSRGDNGGLSVAIALQAPQMEIFEKLFYEL